ncbi:protein phosphatase 2C-like protein [Murinocardiopsis flavida]|uniref:Protein phosphatase 2C-like protein n=1 Tax=Murinocardiopsis flavida TaxID=645275 RepID=A0A2P8CUT7_9ACTN|nr:protein phosphatase 2C domain-containing protein [Murinocardiopsis flavida]PSK88735.1 protein phosphatase 2C-like protein [Murinocardiopsis flavida]
MPFHAATSPGDPDRDNEDFTAFTTDAAVLLDGAGTPSGIESGCVHGVAWFTRRLGGLLLSHLAPGVSLADALAESIEATAALHADTCDLTNQDGPSATVVIVRFVGDRLDYLVLSDSVLLIDRRYGGAEAVTDTRLDDLKAELRDTPLTSAPGTPGYDRERAKRRDEIRAYRNVPGGFWTAGADPGAAREAITATTPLDGITGLAMLSDGASRPADLFGRYTWRAIMDVLAKNGPEGLIRLVRTFEDEDPEQVEYPRGKDHDDATAVYWHTD